MCPTAAPPPSHVTPYPVQLHTLQQVVHISFQLLMVNALQVGKQLHVFLGREVLPQNIVLGGGEGRGGEGRGGEVHSTRELDYVGLTLSISYYLWTHPQEIPDGIHVLFDT